MPGRHRLPNREDRVRPVEFAGFDGLPEVDEDFPLPVIRPHMLQERAGLPPREGKSDESQRIGVKLGEFVGEFQISRRHWVCLVPRW
jgi:hypothetical protein